MTISNTYRWNGKLGSNWQALVPAVQSNWDLISNPGADPSYPAGLGDLAVFDLGGAIDVTAKIDTGASGIGGAEEIQIVNASEVTFSQDNFNAGFDGSGGLIIDEGSSLTLVDGADMPDAGSLDVVGLTSAGTLNVASGTGFDDPNLILGADEGASGVVTVDGAMGFEVAGSSFDGTTGVLTVGQDGDGSIDVTDTSTFYSTFATLGKNDGSSGSVTLDDSIWSGFSLTVGLAGTGTAMIESGSTVTFSSISIGPDGDLDVSGAGGATSQVIAPNVALNFGTIDVTGGGEVLVGTGTGAPGQVWVGGIPLVGLGLIKGDVALQAGGIVEAELPVPGELTIDGNVLGNGTIEPVQTLEVTQGIGTGVAIVFNTLLGGTGGELVLDTPRADLGTIVSFAAGNTIDILGSLYSDTSFTQGSTGSAGTLTLSGSSSPPLSIPVQGTYLPYNFLATPGTTDTLVTLVPCFAAGTRIATARGDVAVERIEVGELVRVLLGAGDGAQRGQAQVIWAGWREVDCARHKQPRKVWPVRVAAGAFGPGMPQRDLLLSPDHAVYVGEVLIPVKYLLNGSTIVQVPVERIVYHHLELAEHNVLLAEGLPAESFLDLKDRSNYAQRAGPVRLYPDFTARMWEAFGCARLVVTGPELEAVRGRLRAVARRQAA